jgi:hypothetical protein
MPQTTPVFGTAGVTRAWTDVNRNFAADCDLQNPAAQNLQGQGGDICGVMSNTNFGQNILTNDFAPEILEGWGVRPSDWNLSVSVQHQVLPRAAVEVAYIRRWYRGFFAADNVLLQSSDLTPFSIVAPEDPRLPDGGGYVVSGLYDVVPEKAGQVSNLVADSAGYGRWEQRFDGIDFAVNVRAGRFTLAGGTSTGQTVADNCEIRANLPELSTATAGTSAFGAGLANSVVLIATRRTESSRSSEASRCTSCRGSTFNCRPSCRASRDQCSRRTTSFRMPTSFRRWDGICPVTRRM